ncbi:histidine kinase [Streptomyces sp. MP131-18]|uniref:sensor histidine kinase n=1 Tax=Streptomyces sp. MP131-18 TaxID=1857892 RepID=UPI00097C5D27|nr:histidine kinase [Streptomyces sp. MP131-18]ONK11155.1 Sensor histidine kinase LiaS [Streptomyces sp. MP131-18]
MLSPPRPHRDDVLIAVAGLAGGLVAVAFGLYTFRVNDPHGPEVMAGLLLTCAAELLRRIAPGRALALGGAGVVIDLLTGGLLAVIVMFSDLVYAAALYGRDRLARSVVTGSVVLTVAITVGTLAWLRKPEALLLGAVSAGLTVAPAWTGLIIRNHRDAAAAERLRAEQTALLAEMDRVQAVAAERSRMARELHDRVANHLSAIAIHSTAALSLGEPAATREALSVIRENSTQGLTEMRRLIGLLREAGGGQAVEASPSLDGLDALLREAARNGAAGGLRFSRRDERPPDAARPPAPVELAAYRIVQESLTNAVKHAAPGEVTVTLRQDAQALRITVTSPFHERTPARAPGSRAGLVGMRERVDLLGGTFEAGPAAPASWRVEAALPLRERTPQS